MPRVNPLSPRRPAPVDRFDRRLLAPLMLGAILNPVNSSIIAVALAPIGQALGAPASETAWLISGLYLATAIGQPLVGRLVDMFGARALFLIGTSLTAVAGVIGLCAWNVWVLVAARVLLGFGTCAGYPAAMTMIRRESDRTGMRSPAGILSTLSVTTQTIATIGPTLGGLLIDVGGWRAIMAVNIPLGVTAFVVGWLYLPRTTPGSSQSGASLHDIDVTGIGLFAGSLLSFLLALVHPAPRRTGLLVALALALGVLFVRRERRTEGPFIDVRAFTGNGPLMRTYVRSFLASVLTYTFLYGYSQWLEDGAGYSASAAGLILLPTFAIGLVVVAVTGRSAVVRPKLLVGAAAQVLACVLMLGVDARASLALVVAVPVVLGIPQGLVNLANQNAMYFQAPADTVGASAGLLRTFMYMGAIVSSSAVGIFFGQRADTAGLHELGWFAVVCAAVLLAMSLGDRSLKRVTARSAGSQDPVRPREG